MIELAEIVRRHGPGYRARFGATMPVGHRRALAAIERCRTPALGGHLYHCTHCAQTHYGFHSCHHRSCPQCGGAEAAAWLARQGARLLPVPYFMVTFTLPEPLREPCRASQRWFYKVFFEESAAALQEVAATKKHLGAELGFTGVLHTWTRQLHYHPHVHYIVPGGGLRLGESRRPKWRQCRRVKDNEPYLLPVRVLSATFRERVRARLAAEAPARLASLGPAVWTQDWVVHSLPVGSGLAALKYLGAYVFRTALSNQRLLRDEEGKVSFRYTESETKARKVCTLEADEFLRRFLQHVLPRGFHKIRYFGWMHPRAKARFRLVQSLLAVPLILSLREEPVPAPPSHLVCPHCGKPALQVIAVLKRRPFKPP